MTFPSDETLTLLSGPVGNLEILTWTPEEPKPITAIICHPHPLFGGTMQNKVVTTIARALHELSVRTVRFNFRGVGQSEGSHDQGRGETEDTLFIAEWIQSLYPNDAIWLAGFSFGAYVAASAATRWPVTQLITIAPQVSRFLETQLLPITCPWVLIQGENDEVVSSEEVFAWVESLHPKPTLIRFPKVGHFFHGHLLELRKALTEALKSAI